MLTVVIPAYNEEKVIADTLAAVAQLRSPEPWEVILVDNVSTDRTVAIARQWLDKLPLRIVHEEKKSRGAARAKGFAEARGRIVFSTDADTQPPPDWLEKMLAPFHASDVVAASCMPYIDDASRFTNFFFNTFGRLYFWLFRWLTQNNPLVGFGFAVRRHSYVQVGGFNTELKAEEDLDLGLRLAKIGRISFVTDVRVHTSGRRWQKGILAGMWPYAMTSLSRLRKQKDFDLSDVR